MADTYYDILGVPHDATTQEIKRAFRRIARECHPDVSGDDPAAEGRFKSARQAYETLMDPVTRTRYDRRGQRRMRVPPGGGSFFHAFYRATGEQPERPPPRGGPMYASKAAGGGPRGQRTGARNPGNAVSLDDLFNDFGFGAGGPGRSKTTGPGAASPPPTGGRAAAPLPGDDVHIDLEVPEDIAGRGGSVTAVYYRMQRADSWRPGATDPGLVRIQDIADVRIVPGTRAGEVLRERGQGNAGAWGGPYGDLVASVRTVRSRTRPSTAPTRTPPPRTSPPRTPPLPHPGSAHRSTRGPDGPTTAAPSELIIDVSMVEAVLGGRVQIDTPRGSVKLTIPPGTSGGTRMRLKARGPVGRDGQPTDLYLVTRVTIPSDLDGESKRLIEAFARLNPSG